MLDFSEEIDRLESLLSSLEDAQQNALKTEYYSYMATSLELDIDEIKARLDELYPLQEEIWQGETKEQNLQYQEARI